MSDRTKDTIKSVVSFLGALFGIYNLIASRYGWAIIQFDSATVSTAVYTLVTLVFGAYSTWKNCNLSPIAKDLQAFKNAVKSGDIKAIKEAFEVVKAIKDEAEKNLAEAQE